MLYLFNLPLTNWFNYIYEYTKLNITKLTRQPIRLFIKIKTILIIIQTRTQSTHHTHTRVDACTLLSIELNRLLNWNFFFFLRNTHTYRTHTHTKSSNGSSERFPLFVKWQNTHLHFWLFINFFFSSRHSHWNCLNVYDCVDDDDAVDSNM